jgi:hypothetical protein
MRVFDTNGYTAGSVLQNFMQGVPEKIEML